jgi:Bcr/CflA subfamily drug resistance transporter
MWRKGFIQSIALLTPLVLCSALAQDIYIPSLPNMVTQLHATPAKVQLTLSLFMIFTGCSQLFIGPLSDHFGRRQPALFSTVLYIIGSLFCSFATNVKWLIIGRILQAIGSCGTMLIAFAVVRDTFTNNTAAKIYSYINSVVGISPLIAPFIGAYLDIWFSWRASFVFLTSFGILTLLLIIYQFEESQAPARKTHLNWKLLQRYFQILKNIHFLTYGICASSSLAVFFTYFSMSPFLLITHLHIPQQRFGIYFATIAVTASIGSYCTAKLLGKISLFKIIVTGCIGMIASAILMISWHLCSGLTLLGFLLPMSLAGFSCSLFSAAAAGALEPFENMAGSAAALLGAGQFCIAALVGSIAMQWQINSTVPLACTILALALINLMICFICAKRGSCRY